MPTFPKRVGKSKTRSDSTQITMVFQIRKLLFQTGGKSQIISIHHSYISSFCFCNSYITCRIIPLIFFIPHIHDTFIPTRKNLAFRIVIRTVIDNDQLEILKCLVQNTFDRILYIFFLIIDRHDYRYDNIPFRIPFPRFNCRKRG